MLDLKKLMETIKVKISSDGKTAKEINAVQKPEYTVIGGQTGLRWLVMAKEWESIEQGLRAFKNIKPNGFQIAMPSSTHKAEVINNDTVKIID